MTRGARSQRPLNERSDAFSTAPVDGVPHAASPVQLALWNFVKYNVAGGGESARYGVEPWSFYLRNGALNFTLALPLALAYPFVALLQGVGVAGRRLDGRVATAVAPLVLWLAALSALPHKEERFLYVVYPQVRRLLSLALGRSLLLEVGNACCGALMQPKSVPARTRPRARMFELCKAHARFDRLGFACRLQCKHNARLCRWPWRRPPPWTRHLH